MGVWFVLAGSAASAWVMPTPAGPVAMAAPDPTTSTRKVS
jgi:hypothetical protein